MCMPGTFGQYGVIHQNSAVRVDDDLPLDKAGRRFGDCDPTTDIPRILGLYQSGDLKLDENHHQDVPPRPGERGLRGPAQRQEQPRHHRPPALTERRPPRYRLTLRPKTNVSVGVAGRVVVPSWAVPASLLTAGMAKYWKVMVVSPGRVPGSTSKVE
jgi:hypothetical protein